MTVFDRLRMWLQQRSKTARQDAWAQWVAETLREIERYPRHPATPPDWIVLVKSVGSLAAFTDWIRIEVRADSASINSDGFSGSHRAQVVAPELVRVLRDLLMTTDPRMFAPFSAFSCGLDSHVAVFRREPFAVGQFHGSLAGLPDEVKVRPEARLLDLLLSIAHNTRR